MNKFYKSIKLTAFVLVLVSLAGCKKDVDVIGISDNLANKTMLGYYTNTVLDSVNMQTSKKEYFLERDDAGNQKGYYRESKAGNGVFTDEKTPMTWEASMSDDQLSMLVTATLQGGKTKSFKWADGIIYENGNSFAKSAANLSNIDVQNKVYSQVGNATFEIADTTFFDHQEKRYYLGWKTDIDVASTEADANKKAQAYIDDLEANYHDTIVWYLRTKAKDHKIGMYAQIGDTVVKGEDTTFVLVGLAVVEPLQDGNFAITYVKKKTGEFEYVQINDRPSKIVFSSMIFKDADSKKTGSFKWQKSEFSKEHYTRPGTSKDTSLDSMFVFTATEWAVPDFTNQAKFDVLFHGTGDSTITETKAGAETQKKIPMKEKYFVLPLSNYTEKKDKEGKLLYIEVTMGDLKYRKK